MFAPKGADESDKMKAKSANKKKGGNERSKSPAKRGGGAGRRGTAGKGDKGPATGQTVIDRFLKRDPPGNKNLVRLLPLIDALRSKRYIYINALYLWDMVLTTEEIMSLVSPHLKFCK